MLLKIGGFVKAMGNKSTHRNLTLRISRLASSWAVLTMDIQTIRCKQPKRIWNENSNSEEAVHYLQTYEFSGSISSVIMMLIDRFIS